MASHIAAEAGRFRLKEVSKQEQVRDASALIFHEKGYSSARMQDIADALGMTKPYIYQFFRSKRAILEEICAIGTHEVLEAVRSNVARTDSCSVCLTDLVVQFTAVALKRQRYVAIYFRESIHLSSEADIEIKNARRSIDDHLTSLIERGVASGEFDVADARLAALSIAGMMSYAFAWYRPNSRFQMEDVCAQMASQVVRAVASPQHT